MIITVIRVKLDQKILQTGILAHLLRMVSWNLNIMRFGGDLTPQSSSENMTGCLGLETWMIANHHRYYIMSSFVKRGCLLIIHRKTSLFYIFHSHTTTSDSSWPPWSTSDSSFPNKTTTPFLVRNQNCIFLGERNRSENRVEISLRTLGTRCSPRRLTQPKLIWAEKRCWERS